MFVDVASIVAGYSLQTGVTVNGVVSSEHAVQGNYGSIGGQAICSDRPTITCVPMTGDKFQYRTAAAGHDPGPVTVLVPYSEEATR